MELCRHTARSQEHMKRQLSRSATRGLRTRFGTWPHLDCPLARAGAQPGRLSRIQQATAFPQPKSHRSPIVPSGRNHTAEGGERLRVKERYELAEELGDRYAAARRAERSVVISPEITMIWMSPQIATGLVQTAVRGHGRPCLGDQPILFSFLRGRSLVRAPISECGGTSVCHRRSRCLARDQMVFLHILSCVAFLISAVRARSSAKARSTTRRLAPVCFPAVRG